MTESLHGIIVPIVTPFDSRGKVDVGALGEIVDFLIEGGVHGIFVCGTGGEFFSLSTEEIEQVISAVAERASGRVAVVANIAAIATDASVKLARHAEAAGVDALAILPPYYIRPSTEEILHHFQEVASAALVPVLAYNIPKLSGVNLEPKELGGWCESISNLVGVKDSTGDLFQALGYLEHCPDGFRVFAGLEWLIHAGLALGLAGTVSGCSNFLPRLQVAIYDAFLQGNLERSQHLQRRLNALRSIYSLGNYPAVAKAALNLIDLPGGIPRRPLEPLGPQAVESLRRHIARLEGWEEM
jgi:4-hydroxy-tetrahydrodipicolinate synthase